MHVLEACYHQEARGFVPYLSNFGVLRIEPKTLYMLNTCSIIDLYPDPNISLCHLKGHIACDSFPLNFLSCFAFLILIEEFLQKENVCFFLNTRKTMVEK